MISANDATVRGGTTNPFTVESLRAQEIARETACLASTSSSRAALTCSTQAEIFTSAGAASATCRAVGGGHSHDRARLRQLHRWRRLCPRHLGLRGHGQGAGEGVPRRAAAGEDGDGRGGGRRVAGRRGDAHARLRRAATTSPRTKPTPCASDARSSGGSTGARVGRGPPAPAEHRVRPDELLGVGSRRPAQARGIREVIARLVDGSRLDEFKPNYGTTLVTGCAHLTASRSASSPTTWRAVPRVVDEGGAVHPARQPVAHAADLPAEHHRLYGRRASTSRRASSSTARR